ncbi:hypothetical protein [Streptomyces sp. NPDC054863]
MFRIPPGRRETRPVRRPVLLFLLCAGCGAVLLARRLAADPHGPVHSTPGLRTDAADHFRTSW